MKFCKYQGAGNDFVIADNMDLSIAASDIPALAADVCDRRFGVGADGFILAEPSGEADVKMDFYNADGSEASMCGNGIRCFAKFVTDHSIVRKTEFSVETGDGVKHIQVLEKTPSVTRVRVDMGTFSDKRTVKSCGFETVSMHLGVPHAVIFSDAQHNDGACPKGGMEALDELACAHGRDLEYSEEFAPERTNVNFVQIRDESTILCSTWERGAGKTLACGTGACSSAVAAHFEKGLSDRIKVLMPGGEVTVTVSDITADAPAGTDDKKEAQERPSDAPGASDDDGCSYMIYMEGTAVLTFKGEYLKSW